MEQFGRYELLGELGLGTMGVMPKVRHPQIDRLVELKVISCCLTGHGRCSGNGSGWRRGGGPPEGCRGTGSALSLNSLPSREGTLPAPIPAKACPIMTSLASNLRSLTPSFVG